MKHVVALSLLFPIIVSFTTTVVAIDATDTATSDTNKTKQIEELKERLATKVAQLRQTQRKALFGNVKSVSLTSITIETKTKDVKIELSDPVTVIDSVDGKRTKRTTDDIKNGSIVCVFGEYDASLDLMKAKAIIIQKEPPSRVSGTVSAIDKKEYTITLVNTAGPMYIIDIERTTKTMMWEKEKGLYKGGFSKVEIGNTIFVTGTKVPKKENRVSAERILDVGNMGSVPHSPQETPASSETPTATPPTSEMP